MKSLEEKFLEKIVVGLHEDDCWQWKGCLSAHGYAVMSHKKKVKGSVHHNAKLNEAVVRLIRLELMEAPSKDLAVRFGVWPEAINKVKAGTSWKHVN